MHTFKNDISHISLPTQFTYPFHYTPHALSIMAAEEVKNYLLSRTEWHTELQEGKMFGVLVVCTPEGKIGFLAAFSGNLAGSNHHDFFVPPIYDLLNPDGYFKEKEAEITKINHLINSLPSNDIHLSPLKEERKQRSIALQQWIFHQFQLRNALGETQDICEIFNHFAHRNPPAGTGECAAPKLLQYAYLKGYKPLAMAEFWWGNSPKGEIRRHGNYYPSCRHKCEPILNFMLQGLEVEPNPLLTSNTDKNQLQIIYEDEYLLVVNKPAGMLSVPGKTGQASVLSILQERYPEATGPLLVHRLDMDTSGLLLAAKEKDIHSQLQAQFEGRSIKKRYIALLEGNIDMKEKKGFIRLPMRPDYDNRPFQLVDYELGKPAVTRYEILNTEGTRTRIAYWPETGRTHQLRVHSAHPDGMNAPIIGDPLYGQPANRLYLHAESLEFRHPVNGKTMKVHSEACF